MSTVTPNMPTEDALKINGDRQIQKKKHGTFILERVERKCGPFVVNVAPWRVLFGNQAASPAKATTRAHTRIITSTDKLRQGCPGAA